jgi:predicted short-subunit dehydrogenase-like oxidoreductase (DUF2520 family)
MKQPKRPPTAILGAGRLGRALLPVLLASGYPVVAVAATSLRSARSAVRGHRGVRATDDATVAASRARLLLLAVPDRQIGPLASELATAGISGRGLTAIHHAGALGLAPLQPLEAIGARIGLIHPLQTLGHNATAARLLPGSHARVEGGPAIRRVARDLGLRLLKLDSPLSPAGRSAYHAAASLLSNDLLALLDAAVRLFESAGLDRQAAVRALGSLAGGTLRQAADEGFQATLTGPVVRGDMGTVDAHLARLRRLSPGISEVHRLLSLQLLDLARREGLNAPRGMKRHLLDAAAPGGRSQGTTV